MDVSINGFEVMRLAQSDLRSLTVFRAVVEAKGFVGAQTLLGMSQSNISFHLKALETRLGYVLCERGRGGFGLTERGRRIYEASTNMFLALNEFESDAGKLRDAVVGELKVGLVDNTLSCGAFSIPNVVRRLARHAPDATIKLRVGEPEELNVHVSNGLLDAAIAPETKPIPGLRTTPLFEERHILLCAKAHPLFREPRSEITPERVAGFPFVTRGYGGMKELSQFPEAKVLAVANHMEVQAMFILSGAYVGYLPDHLAARWLSEGKLCELLPETAPIASPFVLVTRAAARTTALMDSFVQELVATLSEALHRQRPQARA